MKMLTDRELLEAEDCSKISRQHMLLVGIAAIVTGVLTGILATIFMMGIKFLGRERISFVNFLKLEVGWLGLAIVMGLSILCVLLAVFLVRKCNPAAKGSGIPRVEAELRGELPRSEKWVISVKILGGWLALGSGLVLGREGPTVHIGSVVGGKISRFFGIGDFWMVLKAAGAGAGMGAAFNTPLSAVLFVSEELIGRFRGVVFFATALATVSAVAFERIFFGRELEFPVQAVIPESPITWLWLFVIGLICGFVGLGYNKTILEVVKWSGSPKLAQYWWAKVIGISALMSLVVWWWPEASGGGDSLIEQIMSEGMLPVGILGGLLAIRFVLGPLSYAVGSPGGLFAPIVSFGAMLGLGVFAFGEYCQIATATTPGVFAVAGVAGFLAATTRAPLTGIALAIELTGAFSLLFPLLIVSGAVQLVMVLTNNPPIYSALAAPDIQKFRREN